MASQIQKKELDTLVYMIHTPNFLEPSLPTPPSGEVVFFEIYKDKAAFVAHVNGPIFTDFVKKIWLLILEQ